MAPSILAQRRTHNILLFQKLLNLRDGASPFTLLLDTLEQSAQPVVQEFMMRAKVSEMDGLHAYFDDTSASLLIMKLFLFSCSICLFFTRNVEVMEIMIGG
jgi:hypothetical protein